MEKINKIIWGILLVVAGVLFALNTLEITDIDLFFDGWWTLFLIVPCGISLFTKREKMGSLTGLLLGVLLLLHCRDILDFGMVVRLFIPGMIVFIGIKLLWGGLFGGKAKKVLSEKRSKGAHIPENAAIFNTVRADYSGREFDGAELTAVFGSLYCDLRNATIREDCVLKVSCVFGGMTILVPSDVNVKVETTSLFGGVSDRKVRGRNHSVTLYVTGECLFGGVDLA